MTISSRQHKDVSRKDAEITGAFLATSLETRWKKYRKALNKCRDKYSEKSVHQLRVETRRFLALLDVLESVVPTPTLHSLRRDIKRLFKSFSRLRDTHVQLLFVQKSLARFPEQAAFAQFLIRRQKRLVKKLDKRLKHADRKETKRQVAEVRRALPKAARTDASSALRLTQFMRRVDNAFERTVALRQRIRERDPTTIHRTRIAFKKFRYLVELLQPLLPEITRRQITRMQTYQTMMGKIQDLEVLLAELDQYAAKEKAAAVFAPFHGEIVRQHAALIKAYLTAADQLLHFWHVQRPPVNIPSIAEPPPVAAFPDPLSPVS